MLLAEKQAFPQLEFKIRADNSDVVTYKRHSDHKHLTHTLHKLHKQPQDTGWSEYLKGLRKGKVCDILAPEMNIEQYQYVHQMPQCFLGLQR